MRKIRTIQLSVLMVLFALVAVSLLDATAYAITNGQPDGNAHPYVGLVVFEDTLGHPAWRTTGILLSPTVVLTAGHGTDGAVAARVWFDAGPILSVAQGGEYPYAGITSYEGTPYTMPGFGYYLTNAGLPGFITCDAGIVILSEPVTTDVVSQYGLLPEAGVVDTLPVMTYVDLVGYGVQYQVTPRNEGGPRGAWTGTRTRYYAPAQLLSGKFAISDEFLRCSQNSAQGKGGTAFGDSGGPVFQAGSRTILATTSFGTNANCAGTGYYYRIDQPEVLEWINSFLP
jgi:V8-like Glu-specific endopeptidase